MLKQILAAALVATSAFGSLAEDHDTMYLIKDNHVVGKYKVADVDYASFTLPEGVEDSNISATLDSKGKNTVTYTITTVNPTIAYAHNLLSFYEVDYMAQDMFGDYFNNLPDESKLLTIQYALSYNAYVGIGTRQYTQTDYELDGTGADSRFNVLPGTHYFLCAWEVDPIEQTPLETFVYSEFDTDAPGESTATIDCSLVEKLEQGAHLSITGSGLKYVVTCWGVRSVMDAYAEMLGVDYLLGMFGQK